MGDELLGGLVSGDQEYPQISKGFIIEKYFHGRKHLKRIRRLSLQALEANRGIFGTDFRANKEALVSVAVIRSKQLRNEIAGYITKIMKDEEDSIPNQSDENS